MQQQQQLVLLNGATWISTDKPMSSIYGTVRIYHRHHSDASAHEPGTDAIVVKQSSVQMMNNRISIKNHLVKEDPLMEIKILEGLDPHPNVCSIAFRQMDSQSLFIAYPFYNSGDVFEYRRANGVMAERQVLRMFQGIVSAVNHLHRSGVVHLDISPENVMLNECDGLMTPILIDFGLARILSSDACDTSDTADSDEIEMDMAVGKDLYMAPEMFQVRINRRRFGQNTVVRGKACDVWTLGTTLLYMLMGIAVCERAPDIHSDWLFRELFSFQMKQPSPSPEKCAKCFRHTLELNNQGTGHISDAVMVLLMRMLQLNPNNRITSEELHKVLSPQSASL